MNGKENFISIDKSSKKERNDKKYIHLRSVNSIQRTMAKTHMHRKYGQTFLLFAVILPFTFPLNQEL